MRLKSSRKKSCQWFWKSASLKEMSPYRIISGFLGLSRFQSKNRIYCFQSQWHSKTNLFICHLCGKKQPCSYAEIWNSIGEFINAFLGHFWAISNLSQGAKSILLKTNSSPNLKHSMLGP